MLQRQHRKKAGSSGQGKPEFAHRQVKKKGGSHAVDGMKVEELLPYLKQHGENLKQTLLDGKYQPQQLNQTFHSEYIQNIF